MEKAKKKSNNNALVAKAILSKKRIVLIHKMAEAHGNCADQLERNVVFSIIWDIQKPPPAGSKKASFYQPVQYHLRKGSLGSF